MSVSCCHRITSIAARAPAMVTLIVAALLSTTLVQVSSSGVLEFRIDEVSNVLGRDGQGDCCSARASPGSGPESSAACAGGECRTFAQLCVGHFTTNVSRGSPCTFGKVTTTVLGGNTFRLRNGYKIPIPFNHSWTADFTFKLQFWSEMFDGSRKQPGKNKLIGEVAMSVSSLAISESWTVKVAEVGVRSKSKVTFAYRATCDESYYGKQCALHCAPRSDQFGHYECSTTGQKLCLPGWTGSYCSEAICLPGCSKEHGSCSRPFECECKFGYEGHLCTNCKRYPGCLHGSCEKPFQCTCKEGWGGLFCNQDLNFCTNHKPCKNSGSCANSGQGSYTCTCPPNFTGKNCETELTNCDHGPCQNGATCRITSDNANYTCECPLGFIGRNCDVLASACPADNPCVNGGTCIQGPSGYQCVCPPGDFDDKNNCERFTGCHQGPCKNGGHCSSGSFGQERSYKCTCKAGFVGSNCEVDIDDCQGVVCLNGGTCRDGPNSHRCQCPTGFSGPSCATRVDMCSTYPCANGGTCLDGPTAGDFSCACAPGFAGDLCNMNVNECDPNPCANGATCVDRVNEFECYCPPGFEGSRCNLLKNSSKGRSVQYLEGEGGSRTSSRLGLLPEVGVSMSPTRAADELEQFSLGLAELFGSLALVTVLVIAAMMVYCCRRRAAIKRSAYDEEDAQNEANSRQVKCLDDDPVKGTMIVNSFGTQRTQSLYALNSSKNQLVSNKLSNDYESNLISVSTRQLPCLGGGDVGKTTTAVMSSRARHLSAKQDNHKPLNTDPQAGHGGHYGHVVLNSSNLYGLSKNLDLEPEAHHYEEVPYRKAKAVDMDNVDRTRRPKSVANFVVGPLVVSSPLSASDAAKSNTLKRLPLSSNVQSGPSFVQPSSVALERDCSSRNSNLTSVSSSVSNQCEPRTYGRALSIRSSVHSLNSERGQAVYVLPDKFFATQV